MRSSRGNALFLILIAVALFAALSYAVTQSGRGGRSVDKEQAMIIAAQITQKGASVANTVTRMILTGSDADNIEFESTDTGDDALYDPAGGGEIFEFAPANACGTTDCDGAKTNDNLYGFDHPNFHAYPTYNVSGIGTATGEYTFWLGELEEDICEAINDGLGLANPPVQDDYTDGYDAYPGEYAFCFESTAVGGGYWYIHVLVAN